MLYNCTTTDTQMKPTQPETGTNTHLSVHTAYLVNTFSLFVLNHVFYSYFICRMLGFYFRVSWLTRTFIITAQEMEMEIVHWSKVWVCTTRCSVQQIRIHFLYLKTNIHSVITLNLYTFIFWIKLETFSSGVKARKTYKGKTLTQQWAWSLSSYRI